MSSIGWNHRPLGILRKALTRRRRLAHWRVSARVARMMDLPSVPYARRRIGEVWAIMLVKNEEDILAASVHHALRQGMDRVLVVDNGSTDATLRIVEEIAQTAPVLIGHDREVAYWQSEKMTYLARWAWARGADWIVPMDADEFWFAENDSTAEFLRSTPDDMVEARLWNLFPTERTPTVHTLAAGLRLDHGANTHAKVAARAHPLMWISMGNHRIFRPGMTGGGLHVAHLPWRSESQLARKATQGALALSAAEG